jgi:hypothetical protein
MIRLTEEQCRAVEGSELPVRLAHPRTSREYVLLRAEEYERLRRTLTAEELGPSLYEFEDPTA